MKSKILTDEILQALGDMPLERAEKLAGVRTREWAFLVYPDSAPGDWVELLRNHHIPFAISPLHDKDVNPDGESKKAHYHILITADGVKSLSQLASIANEVCGTKLINIDSARGYYRYFTHLDNPEKYQYNEVDIRWYCGFDPKLYDRPTSAQRYNMIEQMQEYIDEHHINNYAMFVREIRRTHHEWFKLLCDSSTHVIAEYIKATRYLVADVNTRKHDIETLKDVAPVETKLDTATGEIEKQITSLLDYSDENLPFVE